MPYDIQCDDGDFHKVEHRLDDAEEVAENHEEETGHTVTVQEYRMNSSSAGSNQRNDRPGRP